MINRKDIQKELERELKMRERLYPGWIQKETLNKDQAKKQLDRLGAALYLVTNLTDGQYKKLVDMIDKKLNVKSVQTELF